MIKAGLYGPQYLLGAKVRIISSPGYTLFEEFDNSMLFFIQKIEFRVDPDGKFRTGIILEGLPNRRFLPEDLCIVELPVCNNKEKTINHGKENQEN